MDITTIGLGVDTAKLKEGVRELDGFGKAADKAADKADKFGVIYDRAGRKITESSIRQAKAFEDNRRALESSGKAAALSFAAITAATLGMGGALLKTYIQFEKLNNSLKFSTGSASAAAKEIEYIKNTVNKLGLEFTATSTAYAKFSAATKGTALEGQKTRDVFEAIAKASTVLGLSAEETGGALNALQQMVSKGTVSAEELRGQLGERLPGAFNIAARSIGVTTSELQDMLQKGEIVSSEFLPKFAKELTKSLGNSPESAAGSAQAQLNKLSNAWLDLKKNLAESGVVTITIKGVEALTYVIDGLNGLASPRTSGKKDQQYQLSRLKDEQKKYSWYTPDWLKASDAKKITELKQSLGVTPKSQYQPANGYKNQQNYAPNFTVPSETGGYGEDVNKLNKQQDEAARKNKEAQDIAHKEFLAREKSKADFIWQQFDIYNTDRADKTAAYYKEVFKSEEEERKHKKEILDELQKKANENFNEAQKDAKKLVEDQQREWEKLTDNISRSLVDSIMRGFERGESMIKNFKNAITNAFKSYIVNIGVNYVQKGLGAILGGAAGTASASTGTSSTGNIFGDIKSAIDGMKGDLVGSIQELGAFLSTGNGGLGDTIGGFLGEYAGAIADVAPYFGAVVKLAQGDVKGAAFTAAGTAIGSIFGPVGAAIGSVVGSFVGSLFGKKKIPRYGSTVNSTYVDGVYEETSRGKLYDKNLGVTDVLSERSKAFGDTYKSALDMFGVDAPDLAIYQDQYKRGKSKKSGGRFSVTVGGETIKTSYVGKKKTAEQVYEAMNEKIFGEVLAKSLASVTSGLSESIRKLFDGITSSKTVQSMLNATAKLNSAQEELADRFGLTIDNSADVGRVVGLSGDALAAYLGQLGDTAYSFRTQAEIIQDAKNNLIKSFGGDLPSTIDDFDAQIKAVDKTTNAGLKRVADLLDMRAGFIAYTAAIEALNNTLVDSATALGLIDSSNYTDRASYETAQAFAAQGIRATYNSTDANANGKLMVSELQKLREGIAELIKQAQATSTSTLETARILLSVSDGASLITSAG